MGEEDTGSGPRTALTSAMVSSAADGPSELGRVGRSSQQLAGIPDGEPEAGAGQGQAQWLQMLGGNFSHLDISLCVGLYSLSFMGLLAVYTYFRARIRALKGYTSLPAA